MANGDQDPWAAIEHIRRNTETISVSVARIETAVGAHIDNREIHHPTPCPALNEVKTKLWQIILLCLTSAGAGATGIAALFKGE